MLLLVFRFILAGGWDILNKWLADAKKSEDFHIMLEVLKVQANILAKVLHLSCLPIQITH